MSIERMFTPFWDTIAIVPVSDLLARPQAAQLLADLLGKTVQEFLILTQSATLPYLVTSGNITVIKKIEHARSQAMKERQKDQNNKNGKQDTIPICMVTSNYTRILAYLLVQNVPKMEEYILRSMKATSFDIKDVEFKEFMRIEPAIVALHLLKQIGDADEDKISRVCAHDARSCYLDY
jgi:serine/threonine-protein kinase ATR